MVGLWALTRVYISDVNHVVVLATLPTDFAVHIDDAADETPLQEDDRTCDYSAAEAPGNDSSNFSAADAPGNDSSNFAAADAPGNDDDDDDFEDGDGATVSSSDEDDTATSTTSARDALSRRQCISDDGGSHQPHCRPAAGSVLARVPPGRKENVFCLMDDSANVTGRRNGGKSFYVDF